MIGIKCFDNLSISINILFLLFIVTFIFSITIYFELKKKKIQNKQMYFYNTINLLGNHLIDVCNNVNNPEEYTTYRRWIDYIFAITYDEYIKKYNGDIIILINSLYQLNDMWYKTYNTNGKIYNILINLVQRR